MEQHLPTRPKVDACPAGDSKCCIGPIIVVRPFDGNLPLSENDRPEAFPFRLAGGNRAHTGAVVSANLFLVGFVKDRIMEGKHIAKRIIGWMKLLIGVGDRVFDNVNCLLRAGLSRWAAVQGKQDTSDCSDKEREYCREDEILLHRVSLSTDSERGIPFSVFCVGMGISRV